MKRRGPIGRDGEHYEPLAVAPLDATTEAINGLINLNRALEEARTRYRKDLLLTRPPNAFTVREFVANYNERAEKDGTPKIGKRTAEETLAGWARSGEYQRAPMMVAEATGKSRRTYVYWKTPK